MKSKLDDVVFFGIMGGANASIAVEGLVDGRWWMVAISVFTTGFCFWHGRENYMEVRNGITESSVPPSA